MANLNNFNAHEVEPSTVLDPLPAGKYLAAITASEMKATKKKDGHYLELEFTVVDGPCKGRKVWDRLCLQHSNPIAQKIAQGNLSAICRAVGVMRPRDSVELHNLPLILTVKCKKRTDSDEISNEIAGYEAKPKVASQPTPTDPAAQEPVAPWQR